MTATNLSTEWLVRAYAAERAPQRPTQLLARAAAAAPAATASGYYWSMLAVSMLTWIAA